MDKIVALCKRRGFIFQSSEIYGGLASTYDYGHYGVLLKQNVKGEWWRAMVQERDDIVALDAAILMHPAHVGGLGPPRGLQRPARPVPRRVQEALARGPSARGARRGCGVSRCPKCGGELSEPRQFNLMFETHMGPVADEGSKVYLRPETAQGIFVNFKNVLQFARKKPPFGIAQVGKSFRNEITPGNFIFRTREFEQMEMEFFVPPADAQKWHEYWMEAALRLVHGTRHPPRPAAAARPRRRRAVALLQRDRPTSSTSSRWAGPSSRGSRTAATSTSAPARRGLRREARVR